jgi:hypothetical protein
MEAKITNLRARVMRWAASSRRRRLFVAVFALLSALGVSSAGVAYASVWQLDDGFEGNPASTWSLYHSAIGGGGFNINAGTARSGSNNAWLVTQTGWSSVGRTVHLTPAQLHQVTCAAQIYIQPLNTTTLNFEVIDPPTWTYVSLKTVTLPAGSYQRVLTDPFVPYRTDVFVRVSTTSPSTARVDDLTVQCVY